MIAYREVLNDKEDIKKIIEILNNLKQKAEVIILPLKESQSKKMSSISIDTVGFKFDRDEAHER